MKLDKLLTIDDLITAFVEYEEYKNWDESFFELIGYYKRQLELMQKLFGCDLVEAKERIDRKQSFDSIDQPKVYYQFHGGMTIEAFENCIKLLNDFKTPFDYRRLLEGMPPKICRDLQQKYGKDLGENIENLELTYRNIAKELLVFMFPEIEHKQIDGTKLYQLGLPEKEPDLADFF